MLQLDSAECQIEILKEFNDNNSNYSSNDDLFEKILHAKKIRKFLYKTCKYKDLIKNVCNGEL